MNLTARDVMSHPVVSAHEDSTVKDLLALLHERQFSGVPVVGESGALRGVITLTDLLSIEPDAVEVAPVVTSDFHTSPAMDGLSEASGMFVPADAVLELRVGDLMSRHAVTTTEEAGIGTVADLMASQRIHRVIVIRDDALVGIISVMDMLRALKEMESR